MKKKKILIIITTVLAILVMILILVFLGPRYGWRLFGFNGCDNYGIEAVNVTDEYVEIKGYDPRVFPGSFVGYYTQVKDGKMYIGVKFNSFLGVLPGETGDFNIKIHVDEEITEVYQKNGDNENLIWSK